MSNYEELVEEGYNKLHEKQVKENKDVKDNSMFGQEILKELGINQNVSSEYEKEEHEDELLM